MASNIESEENVGLYLDVMDVDSFYESQPNARILQDISEGMSSLKDLLFTTVDRGDALFDNRPTCECGATKATHGANEVCPICLSTIEPMTDRSVLPSLFMATPYQINYYIYPYIYQSLRTAFDIGRGKNQYNPFVALMGRQGSANPIHKVVLNRMPKELIGYNKIVERLPEFVETLVDILFDIVQPKERGVIAKQITAAHKESRNIVPGLYQARELARAITHFNLPYRSSVLPVRSKLLMTLEEGTFSTTSQTTDMYAKAIVYLNNQPYKESMLTPRQKANYRPENSITKFYERYVEFRSLWYKEEGGKGGALRTDPITARSGLVMRSVQSQNCDPHKSNQVGLPYSQSIVVFLAHIVSWYKTNKKWSSDKTIQFVEENLRVYNEELHSVVNSIVQEVTRQGGIAYAIRYPSIYRTSGLASEMAFVKKDPNDRTLSSPASAQPAYNGDV